MYKHILSKNLDNEHKIQKYEILLMSKWILVFLITFICYSPIYASEISNQARDNWVHYTEILGALYRDSGYNIPRFSRYFFPLHWFYFHCAFTQLLDVAIQVDERLPCFSFVADQIAQSHNVDSANATSTCGLDRFRWDS